MALSSASLGIASQVKEDQANIRSREWA